MSIWCRRLLRRIKKGEGAEGEGAEGSAELAKEAAAKEGPETDEDVGEED